MQPTYYVLNEKNGFTKFQHSDLDSAKTEAERLAILHPGDTFKVLMAIAKCVKKEVEWDEVPQNEIPF